MTDNDFNEDESSIQKGAERIYENMKSWFYEHFENPAEHCPYNSQEGGFLFIHGGPYYALEELQSEFSGAVDEDLIEKLARDLEAECDEWAGIPEIDEDDRLLYEEITLNRDPLNTSELALDDILRLIIEAQIPSELQNLQNQLLYQNAVTALEVFLCDFFLHRIENDEAYFKQFVSTNPIFQKEKITLSQVYEVIRNLKLKVREFAVSFVWHRLHVVREIYEKTFEIKFPSIEFLLKAINLRHNIAHRNGKSVDGEHILVRSVEV